MSYSPSKYNNFTPFQSFDVSVYTNEDNLRVLEKNIAEFFSNIAKKNDHQLSYDETVKILNSFWWNKQIRDSITSLIWSECRKK
jgi:hypothetical protein